MTTLIASRTTPESALRAIDEQGSRLGRNRPVLLAKLGFAALLLGSAPALAQVAPNLGTAGGYAVLGTNAIPVIGTVTCTNTGPGANINGNVGSTFNAITNTLCTITGSIDAPVAAGVVADFNAAYAAIDAANPVCDGVIPIVSTVLPPGVYCSNAGTTMGAGVIITLNGNASDVWIFRVGTGGTGALTLNSAQIVMGGTASACNVYWNTAEEVALTDSSFLGYVLAGTAATITRGDWVGGMFATTDATVTDATVTGCAALPAAGATGIPTLSEWAKILLAGLLAIAAFAAMRRRAR
jgi:hypothetical protein